jgi:hypothetical protein
MHDPMTVAFEIRYPWRHYRKRERRNAFDKSYRASFITIWHLDPESDGSDDSCDWFGARKTKQNGWWPGHVDEYKALSDEARAAVDFVWWHWRHRLTKRRWWQHPKWHVHHWRFQVHPLQDFKRWAFSRCAECRRRFSWGYCPVGRWGNTGPQWFRSEEMVFHHECDKGSQPHDEGSGRMKR